MLPVSSPVDIQKWKKVVIKKFTEFILLQISLGISFGRGPVEFLIRGLGNNFLSGAFNILLWIGYIFVLALYARAFGGYATTFLPENIFWHHFLITIFYY